MGTYAISGSASGMGSATRHRLEAAWVEFLLSPAARFACGSVIYVDGGTDALRRSDDWPRSFTV